MRASPLTWSIRVVWLTLPLTLGDLLAEALDGRTDAVRWTASAVAWVLWLAGLGASLLVSPQSLVVLRSCAPAAIVAAVWAAAIVAPTPLGWLGLISAAAVGAMVALAEFGFECVNAASYGDERRFPLRPPTILLLGPLPLLWAAMVPLPAVGAIAVAAGSWPAGVAMCLVGAVALGWGWRSLERLTRRWLVFVPAGLTLVDQLAIVDPTLVRRQSVISVRPAPVGSEATDLTVGATGLMVQIDLAEPLRITPVRGRRRRTEPVEASAVLVAPSRPGALLAHAAETRFPVRQV